MSPRDDSPPPLPATTPPSAATSVDERLAALMAARQRATGAPLGPMRTARLMAAGWTPRRYAEITGLVAGALTVLDRSVAERDLLLVHVAEEASEAGLGWAEVWPWLEIVAIMPVECLADTWDELLAGPGRMGVVELLRFPWMDVPAPVAALAHAAGLDPDHVRRMLATGPVDEAGLRILAEMRGWRFPVR